MDKYGESDANPTPPAPEIPSDLVVQQWLAPAWNWANLSAITGKSYAGRPGKDDRWPADHMHGFNALSTRGWYLDGTGDINEYC